MTPLEFLDWFGIAVVVWLFVWALIEAVKK